MYRRTLFFTTRRCKKWLPNYHNRWKHSRRFTVSVLQKVKKYADVFLPVIRAYCQEHGLMDENR